MLNEQYCNYTCITFKLSYCSFVYLDVPTGATGTKPRALVRTAAGSVIEKHINTWASNKKNLFRQMWTAKLQMTICIFSLARSFAVQLQNHSSR